MVKSFQPDTADKEKIFNAKREALLTLLDRSETVIESLSGTGDFVSTFEELLEQIKIARQRCQQGLFSIALIAEFQSGKSTTLNAFADGREIAPRGLGGGGIKTSACLVKVQSSHPSEERVTVNWRSDQNLMLRLEEILKDSALQITDSAAAENLREANRRRVQANTEEEKKRATQAYYSLLDFKTSQGSALLKQALAVELSLYAKSEQKGSLEMQDKEDLLRFAIIVLTYYSHPTLQKIKGMDTFNPTEIERYLRFPKNFVDRWSRCFEQPSDPFGQVQQEFDITDVMYAFIEEVTYIINSENLKKAGAQIVDCPGLFASSYDTAIARGAMQEASAVWFLLSGDKQLSESDIGVLNLIKDIGLKEKIFFGINYKRPIQTSQDGQVSDAVIQEILKQLGKLGFTASYQLELLYYNAFLALRAMQGEKILDGTLDDISQQQIIADTEFLLGKPFRLVEEAWLESVIEVMAKAVAVGREDLVALLSLKFCAETVRLVRETSDWDVVTSRIKEYVFKTKAWSMLVDFGCEPVINTLEKSEKSLQIVEESAQKDNEGVDQEWRKARDKLSRFTSESQDILENYIDDTWDLVLAKSFWEEVCIPSLSATGKSSASKVLDETTFWKGMKDGWNRIANFFREDDDKERLISERIAGIIEKELENNLSIKSQGWFNSLKKGGNRNYEEKILKKLVAACNQLQKEWTSLALNHNKYLQGLDRNIPEFSGNLKQDLKKYDLAFNSAVKEAMSEGYFSNWMSYITTIFGLMMFDIVFPGIGTLLTIIAFLVIKTFSMFKSREDRVDNISKKITEELAKGFQENRDTISNKLREKLSMIRISYSNAIGQSFANMRSDLEQNINDVKAQLALSQAQREHVASMARKIRLQEIQPLQEEMTAFKQSVEEVWERPA